MSDYLNGWYYMKPNPGGGGFARGPFSVAELRILTEKGEINGETQVRCRNSSSWRPLDNALPLIATLASRPEPKPERARFWRRHKAALLIAFSISFCIIVGKHASTWIPAGEPGPLPPTARFATEHYSQGSLSREGLQSLSVSEKSSESPRQLLNRIEAKKAELKGLQERVTRLRRELDDEKGSLDLDRIYAGSDARRNFDLSIKITLCNAKSSWLNQAVAEMKAKEAVLNSLMEEYSTMPSKL